MGKNFEHDPVKVVAAKGESCVSRTTPKSANITIMACVNGGRDIPKSLKMVLAVPRLALRLTG